MLGKSVKTFCWAYGVCVSHAQVELTNHKAFILSSCLSECERKMSIFPIPVRSEWIGPMELYASSAMSHIFWTYYIYLNWIRTGGKPPLRNAINPNVSFVTSKVHILIIVHYKCWHRIHLEYYKSLFYTHLIILFADLKEICVIKKKKSKTKSSSSLSLSHLKLVFNHGHEMY